MALGCAQELQLLTNKQELETAVERWKAQAEAKGVHLDYPAGALCIPSLSRLRQSFQTKQGPLHSRRRRPKRRACTRTTLPVRLELSVTTSQKHVCHPTVEGAGRGEGGATRKSRRCFEFSLKIHKPAQPCRGVLVSKALPKVVAPTLRPLTRVCKSLDLAVATLPISAPLPPAGMAGLMAHGLSNSGKVPITNLPAPPVPSAPPVDGVQHAARMLGVQQSAAVPDAPVVCSFHTVAN